MKKLLKIGIVCMAAMIFAMFLMIDKHEYAVPGRWIGGMDA